MRALEVCEMSKGDNKAFVWLYKEGDFLKAVACVRNEFWGWEIDKAGRFEK